MTTYDPFDYSLPARIQRLRAERRWDSSVGEQLYDLAIDLADEVARLTTALDAEKQHVVDLQEELHGAGLQIVGMQADLDAANEDAARLADACDWHGNCGTCQDALAAHRARIGDDQ